MERANVGDLRACNFPTTTTSTACYLLIRMRREIVSYSKLTNLLNETDKDAGLLPTSDGLVERRRIREHASLANCVISLSSTSRMGWFSYC